MDINIESDLGLTRISPFTLGKTIHRHIVSPLRQRARLRIFAAEKQVITLKKIWIMKRTLLAIAAAIVMITSANAQRLTNIQAEASLITDKMMVELGLSKAHRNSILSINLSYLNGINSYRDIDAYGWQYRNKQLRRIMSPKQWRRFCESYYFYRPISWRDRAYVHNIYVKYPKHDCRPCHHRPHYYDRHCKHYKHDKHWKHHKKHDKKHDKHYNKYDKHHKHHKHYKDRDDD